MVEHQPSKLNTWVRFPSPALFFCPKIGASERVILLLGIMPTALQYPYFTPYLASSALTSSVCFSRFTLFIGLFPSLEIKQMV